MNKARIALWACLLLARQAVAQTDSLVSEYLFEKGHGSISLSFQAFEVEKTNLRGQEVDIGRASTRSAFLELDYAVGERWLLQAGVPWIKRRYNGPARHDPSRLAPPRNTAPFIDDGEYQSGFQDWLIGVNYLLAGRPLVLQPFIRAHIPTHDYPHFGQSARGQNVRKVELGLEATHLLPFSDWYYRLAGGYVVVEQVLGVNVNHFRLDGELGYFLRPELSVNGFFKAKDGRGENEPWIDRTDERYYQHDRHMHHNYVILGLGGDWYFGGHYQLSASTFRSVWGYQVHLVDWGANVGITRYF